MRFSVFLQAIGGTLAITAVSVLLLGTLLDGLHWPDWLAVLVTLAVYWIGIIVNRQIVFAMLGRDAKDDNDNNDIGGIAA